MTGIETYYYEHQLKNYQVQFMAIFSNMQVMVGKNETQDNRLINVPIYYGAQDRVVAAIKADNTQNKPVRIPAMSTIMSRIDLAPELYKGVAQTRRNTRMPTGGIFPDDLEVIEQRMPVPYRAEFELSMWASNQDQHHQIVEQILMLFDPTLQIQTSDDIFDWTRLSTVELTGINNEENVPPGNDRRVIQSSFTFTVPVYISVPSNIHRRYVEDIYLRVGAVSQMASTNQQMIDELDQQDILYELNFSLSDIEID